ncbi:hypothetical protein EDD17DRAFT_1749148 [Pisolithus thermaeus]|nr:hypothetical protein EDD17DRAFT_1749148 [Pisolithus thermaeus]
MPVIEPSLEDVTKWVREGLPAGFTAPVIDRIVEKLEEDGVYSRKLRAGGAWNKANFYATEAPTDRGLIDVTGNVALLNGLAEKALSVAKVEFPEDPELRQARLLHKWVVPPDTLIEPLRIPVIFLVPVDKADKAAKDLLFEDIAASCEVNYTDNSGLCNDASSPSSKMAVLCLWKQVNRCYFITLSLCGSQLLILQHTRGGSRRSPVIDIDKHPALFTSLLLVISLQNPPLWLDYDPYITDDETGRQVRLYGRGAEHLADIVMKPVAATTFTLIRPIFMAYGLRGRGTRASDVTIHHLLQDRSREDPLFALEVRSSDDEAVFGEKDEYHIFDNPLFDEPVFSTTTLRGIPTLVCWDEVHRPDATGTLVPETTSLLLGHPPSSHLFSADEHTEDRQHLRVAFAECGISIAWFSCAREFFNAMMGAVGTSTDTFVGRCCTCDISDTNVWMRIPRPEPEFIVPDWPKDKGPGWYSKRTGLLGDWGYGKDVDSNTSAQRDDSCVIAGTYPFQATQLMAWEAGLDWAGTVYGALRPA